MVVLRDAGFPVMRAGAGWWAAAASAAATAVRMEGMSPGRGLGGGGWGGPAVTWRPGGPMRSAAVGGAGDAREARGCGLRLLGLARLGSCNA